MWWYNILGDNEGIILHILQIYHDTPGSVLLTDKLISMKRENTDPILTVKIIEWRKFIDSFVLSIEADPSRVVKNNVIFLYWIYTNPFICKTSYIKAPAVKIVKFRATKAMSVRTNKNSCC